MNERIFELAEQAENYATTRHPVSNIGLSVNNEKFVKKFAELIVRECMDVVRDINQEYDGGSTVVNAADEIAEHFGVAE